MNATAAAPPPKESKQTPWLTLSEIMDGPTYAEGLKPVTSGFARIDDALNGGFRPQTLTLIGARTGTGKSMLISNMVRNIALSGHAVLVFKLEEGVNEIGWRMHAAASRVPLRQLLDADTQGYEDELAAGGEVLRGLDIRISPQKDIDEIAAVTRIHAQQGGSIVLIDQVSMITAGELEPGFQTVTRVSNALRNLAVGLNIPIVAVAQVNRPAARNKKDRLSIHDLRDSGSLENDSAIVLLVDNIRKPDCAMPQTTDGSHLLMDLLVGKNRYGVHTGPDDPPITLIWWPRTCRIADTTTDDEPPLTYHPELDG